MRKLLGNVRETPPGSLSRISVTHDHYKKVMPAKGNHIYTLPCPVHSPQTPRIALTVKRRDPDGEILSQYVELVCVLCWNPTPEPPGDRVPVGQLIMVLKREEWVPKELLISKQKRLVMSLQGRGKMTAFNLYVSPCKNDEHCSTVYHVSLFKRVPPEDREGQDWPWLSNSEAEVCIICWTYRNEKKIGPMQIPPWGRRAP